MILEIGKSYVEKFYNGNLKECVKAKDGILWDDDRIKKAHNFGNGTIKHLKQYIENNKQYAYFVEI